MSPLFPLSSKLLSGRGILRLFPGFILGAMLAGVSARPLLAATATTTTLTASPASLAPGKPATLVATVTDTSNNSVFPGTVIFYDGTRVLGSAQLVAHPGAGFAEGTATLNIASFNEGANSITAVFAGTKSFLASTSAGQALTVSGQYKTATTLAVTGTSGNYNLTGTVGTFGNLPPAGNLEFVNDTTRGSLGLLSLNGAKQTGQFVIGGSAQEGIFVDASSGVTTGDFNHDGFLDAMIDGGSLSVYPGKGDGTFGAPISSATSASYLYYTGDFNNDGNLDIMGLGNPGAELFLGNGDGSFQPGVTFSFSTTPLDCAYPNDGVIADFDHDGNLDFVVFADHYPTGSYDPNEEICLLRGNGDGTFKTAQNIILPQNLNSSNPRGLAVGDLNGDNYPDLVISSESRENVLLGNGDGTFKAQVNYALGIGPKIVLGDLNGDGHLDLVVANDGLNTVSVALGKGDGTFGLATSYHAALNYYTVPFLMDLNQDGKLDIVVPLTGDGIFPSAIGVLLGNGDGTFQPVDGYLQQPGPDPGTAIAQGDFNGDGLPDLFTKLSPNLQDGDGSNPVTVAEVFLSEKSYSASLPAVDLPGPGTGSVYSSYIGDLNYTPSTSCEVSPGVTPQAPIIRGSYSAHVTSTSASIGWTTSIPTNGSVGYGTTYTYTRPIVGPPMTTYLFPLNSPWLHDASTFHYVTIEGLTPGTLYYFAPTSVAYFAGCDHWSTTSGLQQFTTAAQ